MLTDDDLAKIQALLVAELDRRNLKRSPDVTAAERMRRYRAKKAGVKSVTVTLQAGRNASEGKTVTLRNGRRNTNNGHEVLPLGDGDVVETIPGLRALFEVRKSFVLELIEAYPAVLVAQELSRAKLWCEANPGKRKINGRKFLTSWMARAQDKGGRV